jgi:flagellar motor switch protein FliM
LGKLREAWSPIFDLMPRLIDIENRPRFAQIASPDTLCILVAIEITIGETESMLNICMPQSILAPVMDYLSYEKWIGGQ